MVDTPESMHIVLELMEGGDLLTRLRSIVQFPEPEAKFVFYQIASALNYLHSKNICHRDLKVIYLIIVSVQSKRHRVEIDLLYPLHFSFSTETFFLTFTDRQYFTESKL